MQTEAESPRTPQRRAVRSAALRARDVLVGITGFRASAPDALPATPPIAARPQSIRAESPAPASFAQVKVEEGVRDENGFFPRIFRYTFGGPSPLEQASEPFDRYLEFVVLAFALNATGQCAEDAKNWSEQEAAWFHMDAIMREQKEKTVGAWTNEFIRDLESSLYCFEVEDPPFHGRASCSACGQASNAILQKDLTGFQYCWEDFFSTESSSTQILEFYRATQHPRLQYPFGGMFGSWTGLGRGLLKIGQCCSARVKDFHIMNHWKFHLFMRVYKWLHAKGENWKSAEDALELLSRDHAFRSACRKSHESIMRISLSRYG